MLIGQTGRSLLSKIGREKVGKQADLEKIDRTLKDGEIRLRTVKTNLDALEKEIQNLSSLESQLAENVKCLKKKNIVAIATEYKKAKEELSKIRQRAIALKNDREHFKKASEEVECSMKKAKEELEKLQRLGDNNVLRGKFGKKDG